MHKILVHSLSKVFHAVRDGWRDVAVALGMAVALLGMGPAYANVDVNTVDEPRLPRSRESDRPRPSASSTNVTNMVHSGRCRSGRSCAGRGIEVGCQS
jgi:hypothetical protein